MVGMKDLVLDPNSIKMRLDEACMESARKIFPEGQITYLKISCASDPQRSVVPSRNKGDERVAYTEWHGP